MLTIYTKDKCFYCKALKKKLTEWGMDYQEVNISNSETAMEWFQKAGHKTVPQLYYNTVDVQKGASTELTKSKLIDRIERAVWPNIDSGIE